MQQPFTTPGARPNDPWFARLAFHVLLTGRPGWITLWLIIIVGGLVALGMVAGPWVPGAITVVAGLTASGATIAKRLGGTPTPQPGPDPSP